MTIDKYTKEDISGQKYYVVFGYDYNLDKRNWLTDINKNLEVAEDLYTSKNLEACRAYVEKQKHNSVYDEIKIEEYDESIYEFTDFVEVYRVWKSI